MRNSSEVGTRIVRVMSKCVYECRSWIMGVGRAVGMVFCALSLAVITQRCGAGRFVPGRARHVLVPIE